MRAGMRLKLTPPGGRGWLGVVGLVLACTCLAAPARDLKYQAYLIWATNAEKSPDPGHKPVNDEVRKKLQELPLKWSNFFEVKRETFTMPRQGSEKITLSDKCKLRVTDVGEQYVEVSLIGKGEPVLKRTQPLPKGEMLVLGGNAPDETGWLVVLKRME
jgi:hypothetical protein